jgi:type II secretion system protein H
VAGREKGFTLVELLVTLVIMVAVFSVAIPQYSQSMESLKLRKSTQEIAAYLRQARNASITESRTVVLVVDTEEHAIRRENADFVYRWPDEIDVGFVANPDRMAEKSRPIEFRPDGTAADHVMYVSTETRQYTISVDWLTGRVKVL